MPSLEAAPRFDDATLDFVYIDGRHDYESVLDDLAAWFPKVKGMLAGHDYVDGDSPEGRFGVRSAVDEFFPAHGLTVYSTYGEPQWPT